MDEKTYLDEYKRTLRSWNLQKSCSRLCIVANIKPEYQSTLMALSNKTSLWDPTGRIYILLRVDKLLSLLNQRLVARGKGDLNHILTGMCLMYPSMVFIIYEMPSDTMMLLKQICVNSLGTAESYVQAPLLVSEAHDVERMYEAFSAVILNIPGPMKMDLQRMREEWKTSFNNVMRKVYRLGRAIRNKEFESRNPELLFQQISANQRSVDLLQPESQGEFEKEVNANRKAKDANLNHCHLNALTAGKISTVDFSRTASAACARPSDLSTKPSRLSQPQQEKRELAIQWRMEVEDSHIHEQFSSQRRDRKKAVDRDPGLIVTDYRDSDINSHENRSRNFEDGTSILGGHPGRIPKPQNANNHDSSLAPPAVAVKNPLTPKSSWNSNYSEPGIKAKRLMLLLGDPALQFIPPQRDLVLMLNCDKFQPLSRSFGLHSRNVNVLNLETGWPFDPDNLKYPLQTLRD